MFICRTLRGVRTHSKARPDGCTRIGWFFLVFAKDSSWITSRSLWTIYVWIYEDSDLKTVVRIHEDWTTDCLVKMQPLHKVFLFYPECSQNTNNMIIDCFYRDKYKNRFIAQKTMDLFIYPYLLKFICFLITWCCSLKRMPEFMGYRFN
jgi:hypothetical protein